MGRMTKDREKGAIKEEGKDSWWMDWLRVEQTLCHDLIFLLYTFSRTHSESISKTR